LPFPRDIKKLQGIRPLSPCTLNPAAAQPQIPVSGSVKIIFQIKITLVSCVSASSEGLYLVSYTNYFLLSMYGAVAEIFCVWKIQNLLLMWDVKKLNGFQLQGASPPWPPDQGLCPWTPLGAPPLDPRYRLAFCALVMEPPFHKCSPYLLPGFAPGPHWGGGFRSPDCPELVSPSLVCITNTTLYTKLLLYPQWCMRHISTSHDHLKHAVHMQRKVTDNLQFHYWALQPGRHNQLDLILQIIRYHLIAEKNLSAFTAARKCFTQITKVQAGSTNLMDMEQSRQVC